MCATKTMSCTRFVLATYWETPFVQWAQLAGMQSDSTDVAARGKPPSKLVGERQNANRPVWHSRVLQFASPRSRSSSGLAVFCSGHTICQYAFALCSIYKSRSVPCKQYRPTVHRSWSTARCFDGLAFGRIKCRAVSYRTRTLLPMLALAAKTLHRPH